MTRRPLDCRPDSSLYHGRLLHDVVEGRTRGTRLPQKQQWVTSDACGPNHPREHGAIISFVVRVKIVQVPDFPLQVHLKIELRDYGGPARRPDWVKSHLGPLVQLSLSGCLIK